jgi:hypothetical protein
MATEKDREFVVYLLNKTRSYEVKWEATAQEMQYATYFKGKYVVFIDKSYVGGSIEPSYWMSMKDDQTGREMLRLRDSEVPFVDDLYELAERASLNVDAAIDEIMKDDLPF